MKYGIYLALICAASSSMEPKQKTEYGCSNHTHDKLRKLDKHKKIRRTRKHIHAKKISEPFQLTWMLPETPSFFSTAPQKPSFDDTKKMFQGKVIYSRKTKDFMRCPECNLIFYNPSRLDWHVKNKHTNTITNIHPKSSPSVKKEEIASKNTESLDTYQLESFIAAILAST